MAYTPRFQNQHDESYPVRLPAGYARTYTYYDCWARVTSWTVDGATQGRSVPSVIEIRQELGKLSGNPAVDGAGGAEDVEGFIRHAGIKYDVAIMLEAKARQLLSTRAPGVYLWAATDLRIWPKRHRCDPDFRGRHAVGIIPGVSARGRVKVMDPVCHGYAWISLETLVKSMLLYGQDHGHPGRVYIGRNTDPKADPAPAPVPVGWCYGLPSQGASLRHHPREGGHLLAVVPFGGRLRVASPSGGGPTPAGGRSPRWLEVTSLGSHRLTPSAWVLTSEVTQSKPPPASQPTNGTP